MINDNSLTPSSIKNRHISGQAKIEHSKLDSVTDAQILIGGSDKKLKAQSVSGDAILKNDGSLLLDDSVFEAKVKSILDSLGIEAGASKNMTKEEIKNLYLQIPGINQFTSYYDKLLRDATSASGYDSLVMRDGEGSISVTVDGLEPGTLTTTPAGTGTDESGDNKLTFDKQKKPTTEIVAHYNPDRATGAGEFEVDHELGYVPDVTVYSDDNCGNVERIEMYVENTDTKTKIKWNSINTRIRALIK